MDEPVAKHGRDILKHVGQQKLQQLIELLELVRTGNVRTGNARTGNLRTGNVRTGNVANRRAAQ
jgi:hypothetical protein